MFLLLSVSSSELRSPPVDSAVVDLIVRSMEKSPLDGRNAAMFNKCDVSCATELAWATASKLVSLLLVLPDVEGRIVGR